MQTNELLRDVKARGGKIELVDPPIKAAIDLSDNYNTVKATSAELLKGCECKACKTNSKN